MINRFRTGKFQHTCFRLANPYFLVVLVLVVCKFFSDWSMPVMGGLEFLKILRQIPGSARKSRRAPAGRKSAGALTSLAPD